MSDRLALIAGLSLAIDNHRKWETAERLAASVKVVKLRSRKTNDSNGACMLAAKRSQHWTKFATVPDLWPLQACVTGNMLNRC
jgi:hypothetical protein